jgi:hypothetical protein
VQGCTECAKYQRSDTAAALRQQTQVSSSATPMAFGLPPSWASLFYRAMSALQTLIYLLPWIWPREDGKKIKFYSCPRHEPAIFVTHSCHFRQFQNELLMVLKCSFRFQPIIENLETMHFASLQ